ncbi:hypothetical protein ABR738_36385 [Streptomyces sp. Edi4]|uniref:hypothetical protein n=1 Tax=Streptomyces sp. Edi4 TaxID=3162527 RepID=UPI0033066328
MARPRFRQLGALFVEFAQHPLTHLGEGRWTFFASVARTSRFAPLRRPIPSLHRKDDRATPPAMS